MHPPDTGNRLRRVPRLHEHDRFLGRCDDRDKSFVDRKIVTCTRIKTPICAGSETRCAHDKQHAHTAHLFRQGGSHLGQNYPSSHPQLPRAMSACCCAMVASQAHQDLHRADSQQRYQSSRKGLVPPDLAVTLRAPVVHLLTSPTSNSSSAKQSTSRVRLVGTRIRLQGGLCQPRTERDSPRFP